MAKEEAMAFETIITAFANTQQASSAIRAVRVLGIPAGAVKRHPAELGDAETVRAAVTQDKSVWTWLFGRHTTSDEAPFTRKPLKAAAPWCP